MGSFDSTVIGDFDETFDSIALVQCPNRQSFLDVIASEEYQAARGRRSQAKIRPHTRSFSRGPYGSPRESLVLSWRLESGMSATRGDAGRLSSGVG
ncbi:MAG: hypothetical protein P8R42_18750 [Candidatus Binatia bacterium]|nr:hypothetical protein [Candidatus Binatia bacterium]